MQYPVNEIFYSLQGEANFAGTPAVFIRLHGCAVGCAFCDTKHTWLLEPNAQVSHNEILNKTDSTHSWCYFNLEQLIKEVTKYKNCRHVVVTGGEPALYNLRPLGDTLESLGYTVQIETSGTEKLLITSKTWVTLSPKIGMPGKKSILAENYARANELKMPIGKVSDIENLKLILKNNRITTNLIWLQPLSCKKTPTKLCISEALKNNWRLSLQLHKFLEIR